ncbi:prepilin peptidase [Tindallia californiensis]|nr:prepilin peptidase [Tindallia californiensis]
MPSFLFFFAGFIGWQAGKNISKLTSAMINWKQAKRTETYRVYREEKKGDRRINVILLVTGAYLAIFFLPVGEALFSILMSVLALLLIRIDQRIRIIPNELVLFLFIVGCMKQVISSGILGLGEGLIAVVVTMGILIFTAFIHKFFSGAMGVGAGDIKLMMALSMILGIHQLPGLLLGISTTLILYLAYLKMTAGFFLKQSFPMALQIMGGFMLALHQNWILDFIAVATR